ncbi:MAG: hypothetical protein ACYCYF_11070 [Anaerolineae bacterium]
MLTLALGVVVIFVTGFALARRGAPYSTLLVTAHKLVALGSIVLLALAVGRGLGLPADWPFWAFAAVSAIAVVVLFASGALLSAGRVANSVWGRVHRIAPYIFVGAGLALILYTQSPG